MRFFPFAAFLITSLGCSRSGNIYRISGNVNEPYNQIANTIADIVNDGIGDSVVVLRGVGSLANLDSLQSGAIDLAIIDNYSPYVEGVSSIMPLHPQVLHILQKRTESPRSLNELLLDKKVFAGVDGCGTERFVRQLMHDYGIAEDRVQFLGPLDLFDADVIFSLTDLLSRQELQDLTGYKLFSIDDVANLGKGSLAEGISTRYPQFDPYVISKHVYGNFTEQPVLTLKMDAVLVGRSSLSDDFVFNLIRQLHNQKQAIVSINPLLHQFSGNFDPENLSFTLHNGARNYLERYEPTFLEKYAEVFSVIISIFVAFVSAMYTIARWRKARKKNKIDIYSAKLLVLRNEVRVATSIERIIKVGNTIRSIQDETIKLVIREKLLADESFSIFLNLSRIVTDEINEKTTKFDKTLI